MAADLPLFIVEMYTPGEIVEARRPFSAEIAADALSGVRVRGIGYASELDPVDSAEGYRSNRLSRA
jgi:hypothetical protein